jgi:hypothetical protein
MKKQNNESSAVNYTVMTEKETVFLIENSEGRAIELTFGVPGGLLTPNPINDWAREKLKKMRKKAKP